MSTRWQASPRTRPEAPAPVTIYDLIRLMARGIDEGPMVARLGGDK